LDPLYPKSLFSAALLFHSGKTMKRKIYLNMKSLEEAREIFFGALDYRGMAEKETIPVAEGLGRILAEPVFARFSSPNFHAAAMDGVALKAEDTFGTTMDRPRRLKIGRDAFWINTGQPLPPETNAVVMIEQLQILEEDQIEIQTAAYPWQYVRKMGEDLVATELLLPEGHRVTAYDLGALIAGGVFEIPVVKRPKVILIPTGSELLDWEGQNLSVLPPGKVPEFNTIILSAMVRECGGEPVRLSVVPDREDLIRIAWPKPWPPMPEWSSSTPVLPPAVRTIPLRPFKVWGRYWSTGSPSCPENPPSWG
jgi:putative molybdopterin biosynthesis protein